MVVYKFYLNVIGYKRNERKLTIVIKSLLQALVTVLAVIAIAPAQAESRPFYIGLGLAQVNIGGDMDGETFLASDSASDSAIAVMPDQDADTGIKFMIGIQNPRNAFEASIIQSEHKGEWASIPFSSEFFSFNIDGKLFFNENTVRPFAMLGLGFTTVTVEDGSADFISVEDAEFGGLDLRFGAGLEIELNENVFADLQIVQRSGSYSSVDGVTSGDIDEDTDVNGDGTTISIEFKYLFL